MNTNKFKKFISDNYKILIPIVLLLVIFLGFIIYYIVSNAFSYSKVVSGSYYQYFGNLKVEYKADITYDKKSVIKDIKPIDRIITYDSTPMYDKNKNIVIFPSDMSVVAPIMNCSEYLTKANSYIKYENKRYSLITNNYNNYLGHYFLYDGDDLYFFIEDITLYIGDKSIELSPFSYIIADNNSITYYDKKNDKIETLDSDPGVTYVKNDYYKVYISSDYIDFSGQRVILTEDVSYLSTIDEMKRITNE
jgi:hypothetical protein